jgi:hypothetical protein
MQSTQFLNVSSMVQESHFIHDCIFQYEKQKEEEKYRVFREDLAPLFLSGIKQK